MRLKGTIFVIVSIFIGLCNRHHYLFPEHSVTPTEALSPSAVIPQASQLLTATKPPPPSLWPALDVSRAWNRTPRGPVCSSLAGRRDFRATHVAVSVSASPCAPLRGWAASRARVPAPTGRRPGRFHAGASQFSRPAPGRGAAAPGRSAGTGLLLCHRPCAKGPRSPHPHPSLSF